jgi:hypothetical protein
MAIYGMNFSMIEILIYANLGGVLGVLFFAFISHQLIYFWNLQVKPRLKHSERKRPVFTKRRRKFIRLKNKYGFPGIVILNPVIISIPISTFLVIKYYGRKGKYLLWLIAGQAIWSVLYVLFYLYLKEMISTLI